MDLSQKKIILNFNFLFDGYGDFEWYNEIYNILIENKIQNDNIILLATFDDKDDPEYSSIFSNIDKLKFITDIDFFINTYFNFLDEKYKLLFKQLYELIFQNINNKHLNINLFHSILDIPIIHKILELIVFNKPNEQICIDICKLLDQDCTQLLAIINTLDEGTITNLKQIIRLLYNYYNCIVLFKKFINYINIGDKKIYISHINQIYNDIQIIYIDIMSINLIDNNLLLITSYKHDLNIQIQYFKLVESGRCYNGRYKSTHFYCSGIDNIDKSLGLHYNLIPFKDKHIFLQELYTYIIDSDEINDDIIYHYAYTRKYISENNDRTYYNQIIIYQYLLLKFYENSSPQNNIYLFIYNNIEIEIYFKLLTYISSLLNFNIFIIENTTSYIITLNNIIIKVRFYNRLNKELFRNLIHYSSSPIFSTGDLSQMEALGYKKVLISDYIYHRRPFIDNFYAIFNKYIESNIFGSGIQIASTSNNPSLTNVDSIIDKQHITPSLTNVDTNKSIVDNIQIPLILDTSDDTIPLTIDADIHIKQKLLNISNLLFNNIAYNSTIINNIYEKTDTDIERNLFESNLKILNTEIENIIDIIKLYITHISDFINKINDDGNIFRIKFIDLIKQKFREETQLGSSKIYHKKYLKYKIKYITKKNMINF